MAQRLSTGLQVLGPGLAPTRARAHKCQGLGLSQHARKHARMRTRTQAPALGNSARHSSASGDASSLRGPRAGCCEGPVVRGPPRPPRGCSGGLQGCTRQYTQGQAALASDGWAHAQCTLTPAFSPAPRRAPADTLDSSGSRCGESGVCYPWGLFAGAWPAAVQGSQDAARSCQTWPGSPGPLT